MLEQIIISSQIIVIDIVMAADNAIIIGIIAANFAPDNRKKIIALGVAELLFLEFFSQRGQITYLNFLGLKFWVEYF